MSSTPSPRYAGILIRVWPALLAMGTAAAMLVIGARFYILATVQQDEARWEYIRGLMLYSRTVLTVDYASLGFVRRGLGGTIANRLGDDFFVTGVLFDLVSLAFLVVPLAVLVARLARRTSKANALFLAGVLALSPQTFLGWSTDLARTDMLVAGFIAWAAVATIRGRYLLGVVVLLGGVLAHETVVIFGAPLLVAIIGRRLSEGSAQRRDVVLAAGIFVVGLGVIVALQRLLSAPPEVIAAHMIAASRLPGDWHPLSREIATYMTVTGMRGVRTSVCWNLDFNPQYWGTAAFSFLVLIAYLFILPLRRRLLSAGLALFVPIVFMLIIANDTGRWLKFAAFNAWLLAAAFELEPSEPDAPTWRSLVPRGLLFLLILSMGHTHYDNANRASERLLETLGIPKAPNPGLDATWMNTCDPEWRSFIGQGSAAAETER